MKKAIITGATGFIGSTLADYFNKRGIAVLALGRKKIKDIPALRKEKLKHSQYLNLEMSKISQLEKKISDIDWTIEDNCVFFNLAWGGENGLSDLNVAAQMENVAWCTAALEVAKKIGCTRFIQIGTMEEAFTREYLNLDHNKDKKYNRHVIYSIAKIAAKTALEVKASQIGMDLIYAINSHVMGPDDDKNSFLQVTLQKLINGDELIFSSGEQYFDVVSVSDCCLGYQLLAEKGKPGSEYWIGSGDPRRLKEYVERMYELFPSGAPMQFGRLPYNDIILEKDLFSIRNLKNDTGYQPTMTYEQTVKDLYNHLIRS